MVLLGVSIGALGWFSRSLWDTVIKLKEDLNRLEVKISAEYVRYDRLQDALKPVLEALAEIKHALHTKQDKH